MLASKIGKREMASGVVKPDAANRLSGEPGICMMKSRAIGDPIVLVGFLRGPRKICQAIVCRVLIWKMAGLKAFWARADKVFKDKAMDVAATAARHKSHQKVAVAMATRTQPFPSIARQPKSTFAIAATVSFEACPNSSVAADAVAWKSVDEPKLNGRIKLRHDALLVSAL